MTRQNIKSLWDEPWDGSDIMEVLLPYRRKPDPDLAARYDALGTLAPGTFGRAFWEIYKQNGYAFPGQEQGVNARFGTPHDSTHVLSGYDTSPQGEILVSTFTAGMHPKLPMEGHILPVIFSWHLGIEINAFAKSARNQLDAEKFWVAWVRGSQMKIDLFAPDWEFWNVIDERVDTVRARYQVPNLDPRHAAGPSSGPSSARGSG
jgi:ubiquinone biosynthesis protein Coq4